MPLRRCLIALGALGVLALVILSPHGAGSPPVHSTTPAHFLDASRSGQGYRPAAVTMPPSDCKTAGLVQSLAASHDSASLAHLLASSTKSILVGEVPLSPLLGAIRDPRVEPRVRALLLILVSQTMGDDVNPLLREMALCDDDIISLAALKAALNRSRFRIGAESPGEAIDSFWRGALADRHLGRLLADSQAETRVRGGVNQHEEDTNWVNSPTSLEDREMAALVTEVATTGVAVSARTFAIRVLPESPGSPAHDGVLAVISGDPQAPDIVRAVAYEEMSTGRENAQFFYAALRRETNPRILAGLCTMVDVSNPATQAQILQALEDIAPLAASDAMLANRLCAALSASGTRQGLEALDRIAKRAESITIVEEAIASMVDAPWDTTQAQDRMDRLLQLSHDDDLTVSATACLALLATDGRLGAKGPVVRPVDAALIARAQELSNVQGVPESLRSRLIAQLDKRAR